TPLAPAALRAMREAHALAWANPSSIHAAGRAARACVESARRALASVVGARPADLIFTAGGTEACNLAVLGLLPRQRAEPPHAVTSALEQPAIAAAIASPEARATVTELACSDGRPPSAAALEAALRPDTALVALQWVNHETGAIAPVA